MKVLGATEIRDLCLSTAARLEQSGMDKALFLPDLEYALPTEDSIREFGGRFRDFLESSGLLAYAEERNDCDDYALHAASFAKIDHSRHFLGEQALAFGIAWIATDTMVHAVNLAVHLKDGQPYLKLCEPQATWNDRKQLGVPHITMREFDIASVRSWQLVCL
jgi:hypothetical protein